MNTYTFENIKNVFVLGDCHGEFKSYFHDIKGGLSVKSEDEDAPHPMELERQARKAAREEAMRAQMANLNGRRLMPHDPHGRNGYVTADYLSRESLLKSFKKSSYSSAYVNSVFIIAGDCGIGFNKPKYYEDLFEKFNKILSYNNSYIIFVRGNHDDPAYFDGERVNLSNIKAVPDYSVISAGGKNILCVGGAVSLDRTWRIKQEERINRFSKTKKKTIYWANEAPVFNGDILSEIVKSTKIDYVVTHTAPSFVEPEAHNGIDEWSDDDPSLISDIKEERRVLDKVYETLRDNGMRPKYWAYGHFDYSFIEKRSDTIFRGLPDGFNPISIDADVSQFTENEEAKKKKSKMKKSAKISSDSLGQAIVQVQQEPRNDLDDGIAGQGQRVEMPREDMFRIEPMLAEDLGNEAGIGNEGEEIADEEFDYAALDRFMDEAAAVGQAGEDAPQDNIPDGQPLGVNGGRNLHEEQLADIYERMRNRLDGANGVQVGHIGNYGDFRPIYTTLNAADGIYTVNRTVTTNAAINTRADNG